MNLETDIIIVGTGVAGLFSALSLPQDMKTITLEKILHVLKTGENEVQVNDTMRMQSKLPLERMLALAK